MTGVPNVVLCFPTAVRDCFTYLGDPWSAFPRILVECPPNPAEYAWSALTQKSKQSRESRPHRESYNKSHKSDYPKKSCREFRRVPWSQSCRETHKQPWSAHERSEFLRSTRPHRIQLLRGALRGFSRSLWVGTPRKGSSFKKKLTGSRKAL